MRFHDTPTDNFFPSDKKKDRCDYGSWMPDGSCCVGCCPFLIWQSKGKRSVPLTQQPGTESLETLEARQPKTATWVGVQELGLSEVATNKRRKCLLLAFICSIGYFLFLLKRYYLSLEGKRERQRRETSIGCLSHAHNWGPGPQPRREP